MKTYLYLCGIVISLFIIPLQMLNATSNKLYDKSITASRQSNGCITAASSNFKVSASQKVTPFPVKPEGVLLLKPVTQNSYEASQQFWTASTKAGLFTSMFYFVKLKFRNNYQKLSKFEKNPFNDNKANKEYFAKLRADHKLKSNHCDKTGGFIHRDKLNEIAKQIHVPFNTLKTHIRKLESAGLIVRQSKGWKMISMSKAAIIVGVELKQLRIKANTKNELKEKLVYNLIKHTNLKMKKVEAKTSNKSSQPFSLTLSCMTIANRLGYKSAMTGVSREKLLEKKGRIIISRYKPEKVMLKKGAKTIPLDSDYFWKRPCNTIIAA